MLRIPDRFWWVQRYGGIVSAGGCLIAAIYCVIKAYDAYNLAQIPVSDVNLQALLRLDAQQFLLIGGQFALFAAMGGIFIWASFSAQKRFQRRQRAMEGDMEAMLLARVKIEADAVPDLSREPLELLERASWGRPYGVIATDDGLWYHPQAGRRRLLRWEEIRLFEVLASQRSQRYRRYRLYSRDVVAVWSSEPPLSSGAPGLTKEEFGERHQALLNLIVVRTGLLPRTLDEKLAEAASGV
jgi:hypothetical protein